MKCQVLSRGHTKLWARLWMLLQGGALPQVFTNRMISFGVGGVVSAATIDIVDEGKRPVIETVNNLISSSLQYGQTQFKTCVIFSFKTMPIWLSY